MIEGDETDYRARWIGDLLDLELNQYVIRSYAMNAPNDLINLIGRIVQIRPHEGMLNSAVVLLRHANGNLTSHEGQSFYTIHPEKIPYLDDIFKDIYLDDPVNYEYSIAGDAPRVGFISHKFHIGDVVVVKDSYTGLCVINGSCEIIRLSNLIELKELKTGDIFTIPIDDLELDKLYYRKQKIDRILNNG